jgi:hypothetical protein
MLLCSFCGKPEQEVAKIIAGPGVYICDVCVALCQDILAADRAASEAPSAQEQSATPPAPTAAAPAEPRAPSSPAHLRVWDDMGVEEMLALLPRMASASDQVESGLQECVTRLRGQGVTWARIGEALGMTRQSAWGRFSGEE